MKDDKSKANIDDKITTPKGKKQKSEIKRDIQEKKNNTEASTEKKPPFEPEKLALTKQEILEFCDDVIKKWENDPSKDSRYIFAMNAVKTSILWTEEATITEIWREIIHWVFQLLYKNAIAQGNEDDLEWSKIMKKLGKQI